MKGITLVGNRGHGPCWLGVVIDGSSPGFPAVSRKTSVALVGFSLVGWKTVVGLLVA